MDTNKQEELKMALGSLDATKNEHWTSDGLPKVEEVSKLLGRQVTRKEITESFPNFIRGAKIEDQVPVVPEKERLKEEKKDDLGFASLEETKAKEKELLKKRENSLGFLSEEEAKRHDRLADPLNPPEGPLKERIAHFKNEVQRPRTDEERKELSKLKEEIQLKYNDSLKELKSVQEQVLVYTAQLSALEIVLAPEVKDQTVMTKEHLERHQKMREEAAERSREMMNGLRTSAIDEAFARRGAAPKVLISTSSNLPKTR